MILWEFHGAQGQVQSVGGGEGKDENWSTDHEENRSRLLRLAFITLREAIQYIGFSSLKTCWRKDPKNSSLHDQRTNLRTGLGVLYYPRMMWILGILELRKLLQFPLNYFAPNETDLGKKVLDLYLPWDGRAKM